MKMANITLFDPMAAQMNRMLQSFGRPWSMLSDFRPLSMLGEEEQRLEMKLDLSEDDKNYIVRADIPGVKKEDIKVEIDGNRVAISAEARSYKEEKKNETAIHSERYEGRVFRSFTLDGNVDESRAQASYRDGLLQLTLPKLGEGKAKRLAIN
jgi:HSP20 family protein